MKTTFFVVWQSKLNLNRPHDSLLRFDQCFAFNLSAGWKVSDFLESPNL
jgi:hypothetical protein